MGFCELIEIQTARSMDILELVLHEPGAKHDIQREIPITNCQV